MASAGASKATASAREGEGGSTSFNPDTFRMSLGDHLEELRSRLILALLGLVVATVVCLIFGERVLTFFCAPLLDGLRDAGQNPILHFTDIVNPFMLYLKVSLIVALAVSLPWIVFQLWLFVAAGLYPKERKVIRRYIPLSLSLLIGGMALAYFVIMPLTVRFLLAFSGEISLPGMSTAVVVQVPPESVVKVPSFAGDPASPVEGQLWYNSLTGRLKMSLAGRTVALGYNPDRLLAPTITIDTYVDLTMLTILVFGLAFQLPLVVLALFKVGMIDLDFLARKRRMVYFLLAIAAAFIAPGDVATTMLALYIPLILLYEFGILLCRWSSKPQPT
jgi:sec-independent protein translocase protein TatC